MEKQRAIGEALMTIGSAMTLVLVLVLFDHGVRDRIGLAFDPHHPVETLSGLGERASEVLAIVAVAARDLSLAHAPLVIFGLAAAILVLFMLRT